MKKKMLIILTILISIIFLNDKINASIITSYDETYSTSNRYYYSTSNTLQNNSLGTIGNVYNGKSYNFTFYLNTSNLVAQSTYDITINANSNDFTKNLNASSIYIKTSNSIDFTNSTNGISLISFKNNATSSNNSNKIVLRIYVNSLTSYTMIDIFNSNYANITSVSNFGIKSLSIEKVDTSGNNEIIENDKNNTQNIINNSNQNTDEIKNTIKDNLNSCKDSVNVFDINNINVYSTNNANYTIGNNNLRILSNGSYSYIDLLLDLEIGKSYTFSADVFNNLTEGHANVSIYTLDYSNKYVEQYVLTQRGRFNMTFTPVSSSTLFRIYSNATNDILDNYITLSNIQVQLGNSATNYEPYGKVCQNKLDETNNILKQDYNYNKNESQSTQEQKQEINNYEQEEDNLRNKLNLNIEDAEVSVNPNANNFIWEVVNKLRTMSGKIVLLFTSVLSLGIMKMILGR